MISAFIANPSHKSDVPNSLARRVFKGALGQLFILVLRYSEVKALGKFSA